MKLVFENQYKNMKHPKIIIMHEELKELMCNRAYLPCLGRKLLPLKLSMFITITLVNVVGIGLASSSYHRIIVCVCPRYNSDLNQSL
jgi:hypothetical protein